MSTAGRSVCQSIQQERAERAPGRPSNSRVARTIDQSNRPRVPGCGRVGGISPSAHSGVAMSSLIIFIIAWVTRATLTGAVTLGQW